MTEYHRKETKIWYYFTPQPQKTMVKQRLLCLYFVKKTKLRLQIQKTNGGRN